MRWILALVAVPILVAALAACSSEADTDNVFYNHLVVVMDEFNARWDEPGARVGRGMNVTRTVCAVTTPSRLQSMDDDPSLSGNVSYKYYEKSLTYADKSQIWTITRPLSWNEKQVLMISLSPRDGCVAIYRHTN